MSNTTKSTNPKDVIASIKAPLHLLPASAILAGSMAFLEGATKYGQYNWRAGGASYQTYLDAILRHALSAQEGERLDPDSGLWPEAHIIASAAIIIDARANGVLIDDRPFTAPGYDFRDLLKESELDNQEIRARNAARTPHHWTRADIGREDSHDA